MLNQYYADELLFLRELGKEFARIQPEAAPYLDSAGADPDVERLLEGFAFLTGNVREKIDDELPELTYSLINNFWPHYLRPFPSATIIQFASQNASGSGISARIPRGSFVDSGAIEGTVCTFQTTSDIDVQALRIADVELQREQDKHLRLRLEARNGFTLDQCAGESLRIFLGGDQSVSRSLYLLFMAYCANIEVCSTAGDVLTTIDASKIRPGGFEDDEALIPYPKKSFGGFRLLQEFFCFPQKFLFILIDEWNTSPALRGLKTVDFCFNLDRLPRALPAISSDYLFLNCTPAVNVFPHDADPVRLTPDRREYKIRPSGANAEHYEVYSIDKVSGIVRGQAKPNSYMPLFSLGKYGEPTGHWYDERRRPNLSGDATSMYVNFVHDGELGDEGGETITMDLLCTNRNLPIRLSPGDINVANSRSSGLPRFRNISKPSAPIPPPIDKKIIWRLISHLSLNYTSMLDVESIRVLLATYDFRAMVDRQAQQMHERLTQGLIEVTSTAATRLFRGMPLRGTAVRLSLDEDLFSSEGAMLLFASVMDRFLSQYATMNSFMQLSIAGTRTGFEHQFEARLGKKAVC